jgi:hypothetical protein
MPMRQGDAVRVVRVAEPAVQHLAVLDAQRAPRPGDVGTVIDARPTGAGTHRYLVEADNGDGEIIWLAEFTEDELRLADECP